MKSFGSKTAVKKAYRPISFLLILTQLTFCLPLPSVFAGDPSQLQNIQQNIKEITYQEAQGKASRTNAGIKPAAQDSHLFLAGEEIPLKVAPPEDKLNSLKDKNGDLTLTHIQQEIINKGILTKQQVKDLLKADADSIIAFLNENPTGAAVTPQNAHMNRNKIGTQADRINAFDAMYVINIMNQLTDPVRQTVTVNFVAANVESGAYRELDRNDPNYVGPMRNFVHVEGAVQPIPGITINVRIDLYRINADGSETRVSPEGGIVKGAAADGNFEHDFTGAEIIPGHNYRSVFTVVNTSSLVADYVGTRNSEIHQMLGVVAGSVEASPNGDAIGFIVRGYQPGGITPGGVAANFIPYMSIFTDLSPNPISPSQIYDMGNGTHRVIINAPAFGMYDIFTGLSTGQVSIGVNRLEEMEYYGYRDGGGVVGRQRQIPALQLIDNRRYTVPVQNAIGAHSLEIVNIAAGTVRIRLKRTENWPPDWQANVRLRAWVLKEQTVGVNCRTVGGTTFCDPDRSWNTTLNGRAFIFDATSADGYDYLTITGIPEGILSTTGGIPENYMSVRFDMADIRPSRIPSYAVGSPLPDEYNYRTVAFVGHPNQRFGFIASAPVPPTLSAPVIRDVNGAKEIEMTVTNPHTGLRNVGFMHEPQSGSGLKMEIWVAGSPTVKQTVFLKPVAGQPGKFSITTNDSDLVNILDSTNYVFQIAAYLNNVKTTDWKTGSFTTAGPTIGAGTITYNDGVSMEIAASVTNLAAGRKVYVKVRTNNPPGAWLPAVEMVLGADGKYKAMVQVTPGTVYDYRIITTQGTRETAFREGTLPAAKPSFGALLIKEMQHNAYPASYGMSGEIQIAVNTATLTLRPGDTLSVRVTMPNQFYPGQTVTLQQLSAVNGVYTFRFGGMAFATANLTAEILVNGMPITSTLTNPPATSYQVPPIDIIKPLFEKAEIITSGSTKTLKVTAIPSNFASWGLDTRITFKVGNTTYTLTRTSPTSNIFSIVLTPAMGTGIFNLNLEYKVVNSPGTIWQNYIWTSGSSFAVNSTVSYTQYKLPLAVESVKWETPGSGGKVNLTVTLKNIPTGVTPTFKLKYLQGGVWKEVTVALTRDSANPNVFRLIDYPALAGITYTLLAINGNNPPVPAPKSFTRTGLV